MSSNKKMIAPTKILPAPARNLKSLDDSIGNESHSSGSTALSRGDPNHVHDDSVSDREVISKHSKAVLDVSRDFTKGHIHWSSDNEGRVWDHKEDHKELGL